MKMTRLGLTKFLNKTQETLECLWECEIQFPGGDVLLASRVGDRRSGSLEEGGFVDEVDLVFKLKKSLYPAMPKEGVLVKIRDTAANAADHGGSVDWVTYRIERVFRGLEPTWTVGCMDPSE